MRDLVSNIGIVPAFAPAVQSAAGDGLAIDLKGFNRVAFAINTGAIVGSGDFGIKVQESDDGSTFTDAAASAVLGTVPATLAAASAYKLGYIGFKRYARLSLTKAGGTSIALGAVALKGDPARSPVA
ncbi:hypothetical protein AncyloWKF20_09445 [Ancylobacter sp. WKF20]|uniref:hypothetical protein n=1 Tax=Ancylobacter sp. WKF20 TaxID=3039801 RepID=UPI00243441E6|nr:hypothetical protein [Ancylobacter sp. WKF20]WGD32017.1 hypothetical protein AncyloWKF20_09445 [Ancylobacter sp. WKF20]